MAIFASQRTNSCSLHQQKMLISSKTGVMIQWFGSARPKTLLRNAAFDSKMQQTQNSCNMVRILCRLLRQPIELDCHLGINAWFVGIVKILFRYPTATHKIALVSPFRSFFRGSAESFAIIMKIKLQLWYC